MSSISICATPPRKGHCAGVEVGGWRLAGGMMRGGAKQGAAALRCRWVALRWVRGLSGVLFIRNLPLQHTFYYFRYPTSSSVESCPGWIDEITRILPRFQLVCNTMTSLFASDGIGIGMLVVSSALRATSSTRGQGGPSSGVQSPGQLNHPPPSQSPCRVPDAKKST